MKRKWSWLFCNLRERFEYRRRFYWWSSFAGNGFLVTDCFDCFVRFRGAVNSRLSTTRAENVTQYLLITRRVCTIINEDITKPFFLFLENRLTWIAAIFVKRAFNNVTDFVSIARTSEKSHAGTEHSCWSLWTAMLWKSLENVVKNPGKHFSGPWIRIFHFQGLFFRPWIFYEKLSMPFHGSWNCHEISATRVHEPWKVGVLYIPRAMKMALRDFRGSEKWEKIIKLDFMGREYTIKYVPCWAMKPYALISWATKILRNQFPG